MHNKSGLKQGWALPLLGELEGAPFPFWGSWRGLLLSPYSTPNCNNVTM